MNDAQTLFVFLVVTLFVTPVLLSQIKIRGVKQYVVFVLRNIIRKFNFRSDPYYKNNRRIKKYCCNNNDLIQRRFRN